MASTKTLQLSRKRNLLLSSLLVLGKQLFEFQGPEYCFSDRCEIESSSAFGRANDRCDASDNDERATKMSRSNTDNCNCTIKNETA